MSFFVSRPITGAIRLWLAGWARGVCPKMGHPLVNIQKAMENGYRNSGFSHETW